MEETKTNGAAQEAVGAQTETNTEPEKTTYTREEVERLLQQEGDRRVTAALKKAEAKRSEAVREAQKLATMNDDEKARYQLEQRQKELDEREERLAVAENTAEATKILAEKGIRTGLVQFVVAADAQTMMDNINTLEKEFKASVKAEVEKRLAGTTPRRNLPPDQSIDKAAFGRMTVMQQQELYKQNPELYKQLTQ